jgi:hypothetical protein
LNKEFSKDTKILKKNMYRTLGKEKLNKSNLKTKWKVSLIIQVEERLSQIGDKVEGIIIFKYHEDKKVIIRYSSSCL